MPVIITKMFDKRLKLATASYDFSSLRYVCSTGGRLSDVMLRDLKTTFPSAKIYSMFGLTEAFRSTYLDPSKIDSHPTSIGKAIPDCQVLVLDENGEECPPECRWRARASRSDGHQGVLARSGDHMRKFFAAILDFRAKRWYSVATRSGAMKKAISILSPAATR